MEKNAYTIRGGVEPKKMAVFLLSSSGVFLWIYPYRCLFFRLKLLFYFNDLVWYELWRNKICNERRWGKDLDDIELKVAVSRVLSITQHARSKISDIIFDIPILVSAEGVTA
ncbi:hypothetical protein L873DRAFT_1280943 [Choiromyces venosus 120613-1]|uniref:Uncharacterized protein n=1 Tax=Choiromyces venosus 120613-1 TaxID=1336337 RepID=A0A3N4JC61_9PEZI|nr:hypothetical protein L873DRAFT_1280943 [Choiromyces venosus 120613-1]